MLVHTMIMVKHLAQIYKIVIVSFFTRSHKHSKTIS